MTHDDDTERTARVTEALRAAALDLGGTAATRARVIAVDRVRHRLAPLAAALGLAVAVAAVGVALELRGRGSDATPGSARGATATASTSTTASATPTASPTVPIDAPFWPPDDTTLGAPRSLGRLTVVAQRAPMRVVSYRLAVGGAPAFPATAAAFRVSPVDNAPLATLGVRFGFTTPPNTQGAEPGGASWGGTLDRRSLTYDPYSGIQYTSDCCTGSAPVGIDTGMRVTDPTSAIMAAGGFLFSRHLLPPSTVGKAADGGTSLQPGGPVVWRIQFGRAPGEVPDSGDAGNEQAGARVDITADGLVFGVYIRDDHYAGGAAYPLVTWQQAWQQVRAGHWSNGFGPAFGTGAGAVDVPVFAPTNVHLVLYRSDSTAGGATAGVTVPMYDFADPAHGLDLLYPAVVSADLVYTPISR